MQTWFWRTGLDSEELCREAVQRLDDGRWGHQVRPWSLRQPPPADRAPAEVRRTPTELAEAESDAGIGGHDAALLHLLAMAQAARWIPLTPPLSADHLARARHLDGDQRRTLHAVLDGLIELRYRAARGLTGADYAANG